MTERIRKHRAGWNKNHGMRLESLHIPNEGASDVVKGVNRRVVVVKSPDERIFEQAIFIVRDDFLRQSQDGAKQLLQEAQRAAADYMSVHKTPRRVKIHTVYAACGAGALTIIYLAAHFVLGLF